MRYNKTLLLTAIAGFASLANAGDLTFINKSHRAVYVATNTHVVQATRSGDLAVFTPEQWVTTGWTRVDPGGQTTVKVHQDRAYVHLDNGVSGEKGIAPQKFQDSTIKFVHPTGFTQRFEVRTKYYSFEWGAAGKKETAYIKHDEDQGTAFESLRKRGWNSRTFYLIKASGEFTIN
jgi:hypothetical protein